MGRRGAEAGRKLAARPIVQFVFEPTRCIEVLAAVLAAGVFGTVVKLIPPLRIGRKGSASAKKMQNVFGGVVLDGHAFVLALECQPAGRIETAKLVIVSQGYEWRQPKTRPPAAKHVAHGYGVRRLG